MGWGGVGWGVGGGGHVPSLKGLQALVGFQTLGSRPQPTSTPQGCGDNGTSLILGGDTGGGGGRSLTRGGGVRKGVGVGGGGVMVHKSHLMSDSRLGRYTHSCVAHLPSLGELPVALWKSLPVPRTPHLVATLH